MAKPKYEADQQYTVRLLRNWPIPGTDQFVLGGRDVQVSGKIMGMIPEDAIDIPPQVEAQPEVEPQQPDPEPEAEKAVGEPTPVPEQDQGEAQSGDAGAENQG